MKRLLNLFFLGITGIAIVAAIVWLLRRRGEEDRSSASPWAPSDVEAALPPESVDVTEAPLASTDMPGQNLVEEMAVSTSEEGMSTRVDGEEAAEAIEVPALSSDA